MKKIISIILLSIFCFGSEINGFRDMKWGENSQKLGDTILEKENKNTKTQIRRKKEENLTIGSARLIKIFYMFFDDRIFGVFGIFEGRDNFEAIKAAFEAKYGQIDSAKNYTNEYFWFKGNVSISLNYNKFNNEGSFLISYKPISTESERYEKNIYSKGANDL